MKTIASMKGADFLRACNRARHSVSALLHDTGVMEIRKTMPHLTGKETPQEKKALIDAQASKNINAMLDELLDKHAEKTFEALKDLCVLEDGEEPDGLDMACAALEIITAPKVMDFLSSLAKLELTDTAD